MVRINYFEVTKSIRPNYSAGRFVPAFVRREHSGEKVKKAEPRTKLTARKVKIFKSNVGDEG